MKRRSIACTLLFAAACSSSAGGPSGWRPVPGASAEWSTGTGAAQERYSVVQKPYTGTLQDLVSQQTVDVVLGHPGAKFIESRTFAPCPGIAAIAHFRLGNARALDEGLAVLPSNQAVLVSYLHPRHRPIGRTVRHAMEKALCVAPM